MKAPTGHERLFRGLGVVEALSLSTMATSKLVEFAGNLDEDSVVSVIGNVATLPTVLTAGIAAMLGLAVVSERNEAHFNNQENVQSSKP